MTNETAIKSSIILNSTVKFPPELTMTQSQEVADLYAPALEYLRRDRDEYS